METNTEKGAVTLSLAEQLDSMFRQQFSTAILTVASWSSKTWQIAGVPMMHRMADGDVEFSGRFLASIGPEGSLLGVLLRRLPQEMPVIVLCLESQLDLFKTWIARNRGVYGNHEITLVPEPGEGLDSGGGMLLALQHVKTPFVVTVDGNSFIYRARIYQRYLQVQQEKLARLKNDVVGMIMGVPPEGQSSEVDMSYLRLESNFADSEGSSSQLVTGWSERGNDDSVGGWHLNPGFYAFKTDLLKQELEKVQAECGDRFSMEGHVMPGLIQARKIRGFSTPWLVWDDIGTPRKFWARRFTSKGSNRLGDNGLALGCERVVVHSGLRQVGLVVRNMTDSIVTLVHTPAGPFLLIHPVSWAEESADVAKQFDQLIRSGMRVSTSDLHGLCDADLEAKLQRQISLPEFAGIAVWSRLDVRVCTYPDESGSITIIDVRPG